ncbi:MAG: ATP-binding protein [Candidatus Auribacterota bacterium]|jgi:PAS domain S-box-containing protein|nr:ATP-binding protein [Candidatus Auribacterota bacterium]
MDERSFEDLPRDISRNLSFVPEIIDSLPPAAISDHLLSALYGLETKYMQLQLENKQLRDSLTSACRDNSTGLAASIDRIVEKAQLVSLWLDSAGKIIYFNEYMENISGYALHEIRGNDWFALFMPSDDRNKVQTQFVMSITDKSETSRMFPITTRTGKQHFIEWYGEIKTDERGEATVVAVGVDITKRKLYENESIKSKNLDSLAILAGGIAHDFNNLLAIITGNVALAKKHINIDCMDHQLLSNAERALHIAAGLSQQLLTFAQGGAPIKKTTNITDLIKDSALFSLKGSNVKCEFEIDSNLKPVDVDTSQLFQVIHNIVINAYQALPEGGTITVRVRNAGIRSEKWLPIMPGEYVKISVEDHGVGILPEHIDRVFDPYFTTKEKGSAKGVGLGLSTCYSIIRKHGGYITVQSKPNIKTVFDVYLPVSKGIAKVDLCEDTDDAPVSQAKILLMDDEAMYLEMLSRILQTLGYTVCQAIDGKQAVALYQESISNGDPFDAVILDLTIPGGMGGKETLAQLKLIDPDVQAIVASGYYNDPIMSNYHLFGFKGMLPKPSSIEQIKAVLYAVLHTTAQEI